MRFLVTDILSKHNTDSDENKWLDMQVNIAQRIKNSEYHRLNNIN